MLYIKKNILTHEDRCIFTNILSIIVEMIVFDVEMFWKLVCWLIADSSMNDDYPFRLQCSDSKFYAPKQLARGPIIIIGFR